MVDQAGTPQQPTGQLLQLPESAGVEGFDDGAEGLEGPSTGAGAIAQSEGGGVGDAVPAAAPVPPAKPEKAEKPERKKEKTIDWGKVNAMGERFTLIYGTDTVWDADEREIMKLSNMAHAHGSDVVKMWKTSENRKTVRQRDVVFDPTGAADADPTKINLYNGLAMQPKEGDVAPWLDLVRHLLSRTSEHPDEVDENIHWFICWVSYPLQHPGAKMRTAVIIHGDEGSGKSLVCECIGQIYAPYSALVGQDELEDKFNDWRSCKQWVVGDEVSSRAELVHNKNRLKSLITSETVQINPKGLPRREEKNHINVVFLSNEITPLALDNSDRRYFVAYTPRALHAGFYKEFGKWRENGGVEALYYFLKNYPLGDFTPYTPAPVTVAKRDLIDINRKSPELFWLQWSSNELDLPYWSCSCSQAYRAYTKWCQRTGDRFPAKQQVFTRMLIRISEGEGRPARDKVMKTEDELGAKKAERMLLVTEPPEEAQGKWATDCRNAFEGELRKYIGFPLSPSTSADGGEQ